MHYRLDVAKEDDLRERKHPVRNGDYYFHYRGDLRTTGSYWELRKKNKAPMSIPVDKERATKIFTDHGHPVLNIEYGPAFIRYELKRGHNSRDLKSFFEELASLLP